MRHAAADDPVQFGYGSLCSPHEASEADDMAADPVAEVIQEALAGVADDPAFRHSDLAYTVQRASTEKHCGLVVTTIDRKQD